MTTMLRYTLCLLLLVLTLPFTAPARADFQSGVAAYNDKRYVDAYELLLPLAIGGDAMAQFYIGTMVEFGFGQKADRDKAVKYYHLAAEQGLAQAQAALADHYYFGRGSVAKSEDDRRAYAWSMKAAKQGHPNAYLLLSFQYCAGQGVPRMPYVSEAWGILFQEASGRDPWAPLLNENGFNHRCSWLPALFDRAPAVLGVLAKKIRLIHDLPSPEISQERFSDWNTWPVPK